MVTLPNSINADLPNHLSVTKIEHLFRKQGYQLKAGEFVGWAMPTNLCICRDRPLMVGIAHPTTKTNVLFWLHSNHLLKMPELAKLINTDLSKEFTVSQVAENNLGAIFSTIL